MDRYVTSSSLLSLPSFARRVLDALEGAGFDAWVVGGWVRDALRGVFNHNVDIATSATCQESARALCDAGIAVTEQNTKATYGAITAVSQGHHVKITTYCAEYAHINHSQPNQDLLAHDVREDLACRAFTINAMAYHPSRGLFDPFGGCDDLFQGVIRSVGDPLACFEKDALRVLCAVRYSVCLGFSVDPLTQNALLLCSHLLQDVAPKRIGQELDSILHKGKAGTALVEQPEVMCAAIPELMAARGFDQKSVYHVYDVYEHIAHVCNACESFTAGLASRELRWAALLHDIAKPATYSEDIDGHGHFFDHPQQGAQMARSIMRRMDLPSKVVDASSVLVRLHDEPMPATKTAVRELLASIGGTCPGREVSLAFQLFDLRRADAVSKCASAACWAHEMDAYTKILRQEVERGPVFKTCQLAVSDDDIIRACGIKPGPAVSLYMDVLLRAVMNGEVPNKRSALIDWLG